jgi:hypothetical protein
MTKDTDVTGEVFIRLLKSETATGLDHLTVTVVRGRDIKVGGEAYRIHICFLLVERLLHTHTHMRSRMLFRMP